MHFNAAVTVGYCVNNVRDCNVYSESFSGHCFVAVPEEAKMEASVVSALGLHDAGYIRRDLFNL